MKLQTVFNIGDIVESVFWQGRHHPGEHLIRTGPYRIISRSLHEGERSYIDQLDDNPDAYVPPPNWSFVVVHTSVPLGRERSTDHCYLNNYLPSAHPKIMRGAYLGDGDYLIKRGEAVNVQPSLF